MGSRENCITGAADSVLQNDVVAVLEDLADPAETTSSHSISEVENIFYFY